jgi:spore coat polysaccharide biosynthesis protein SpsF (cytidylyltransferase family)
MIGAIIQARMSSTRYPGKSMAMLAGKPVLEHVIERAKLIPFVKKVIVAMPSDKASAPMGELCERMGVETFYGPEDDVLRRYYLAAMTFELETIVRITGDSPFVDPVVAGEVIALLKAENLDYCSNVFPKRTYPKGFDVEVFTFDCLEAAHIESEDDPDYTPAKRKALAYNREHVGPWAQKRKGVYRANVQQQIDQSDINLCVDEIGDIERLEKLISKMKLLGLGLNITGGKASQWTRQLLEMTTDDKTPN